MRAVSLTVINRVTYKNRGLPLETDPRHVKGAQRERGDSTPSNTYTVSRCTKLTFPRSADKSALRHCHPGSRERASLRFGFFTPPPRSRTLDPMELYF